MAEEFKPNHYMDGILKHNLNTIKKNIKKDWDYFFVVDGKEGTGKSVFALQLANYLTEGKFNVNNICFTPEEFKQAVLDAPKYSCVVFDEAFRGWSSRSAISQTNRSLVGLAMEMRQKNLFCIVVLPSIWELDRYIALHRCKGLFHIYTDKNKGRGYFMYNNEKDITYMFANINKYKYRYPSRPKFYGRFTNSYPVSEEEYKTKKAASLGTQEQEKRETKRETFYRECLSKAVWILRKDYSNKLLAEIFDINRHTVTNLGNGGEELLRLYLENGGKIEKK